MHECLWCGKKLTRLWGLKQHMKICKNKTSKDRENVAERVDVVKPTELRKSDDGPSGSKQRKLDHQDEIREEVYDEKQKKITDFFKIKDIIESSQPEQDAKIMARIKEIQEKQKEARNDDKKKEESEVEVNNSRNSDKKKTCPYCDIVLKTTQCLDKHISKLCPVVKLLLQPFPTNNSANQVSDECYVIKPDNSFACSNCELIFTRKFNLERHIKYSCRGKAKRRNNNEPELRRGQINPLLQDDVYQTDSAFNKYLTNYQIMNKNNIAITSEFLESKRGTVKNLLAEDLKKKESIKFNLDLELALQAPDGEVSDWTIKNESEVLLAATDADEVITEQYNNLLHRVEEEMLRGSGWTIVSICNLMLKTSKYEPLRGSSYLPLPAKIAQKRAVINPRNFEDDMCFKYAILASMHKGCNPECVEHLLQYEDQFNWKDITFPVSVHDVKKFEKNNPNVSISVYAIDEDEIIIPQKFALPKERHIDLLLITEQEEEMDEKEDYKEGGSLMNDGFRQHYTYIKKFNALFYSQISKCKKMKYICKRCLTHHSSTELLADHHTQCIKKPLARVMMPKSNIRYDEHGNKIEEKPTVKFNQPHHSVPVPVRIFADSEALLLKEEGPENDPAVSSSTIKQHHVPMSFGYVVKSELPENVMQGIPLTRQVIRGVENPTRAFLNDLVDCSKKLKKIYDMDEPMAVLTSEEQERYDKAENCYMCDTTFTVDNIKVRDHCHITGKYRGAAHTKCNLQAQNPNFVPVILHNNSCYDGHFIIKQLGDIDCKIKVIPNTSENMITFSIIPEDGVEIRFLDSFRFMATSLENLANNLAPDMFVNVEKHFGSENIDLLRQKGVFCYQYVDNHDKLKETSLPPRKEFYSDLYESEISKKDYKHAVKVFKTFKCKDLGEYSDLYLTLDVLLLADVFEAFREVCLKTYGLDPCWYYTAPGLAWNAALRSTGQELELIQDEEMLLMIEKGIRGGVAQCIKRYAKARNKYIDELDSKYKDFLAYLDANNLFGWAMCQLLPVSHFQWDLPQRFQNKENILRIPADGEWGFIFEVDISYPECLHNKHKDLPFLPETLTPPEGKHPKLLTTLFAKKKYVVHYRLLQQALKHGLELIKVHRVIGFKQSPWLKKYIMLNTEERKKAKNAFEKDFYKLMNNAVFGKTMEQVRNRINLEIVNNVKRLRKLIRSPFFKQRIIYDENLCAVLSQRKSVTMCKPVYVGMSILDLSKLLMYEFHYETMVPRYGAALSLCYMDTDSYIYFITGVDFYEEIKKHLHDFDTSDYPADNELYSEDNKKVLGKFKDEANSTAVEVFVGLKAKMYALKYGGKVMKRAKGVKKNALKCKIGINHYINCLKNSTVERVSFQMIRSHNHELFTKKVTKVSLTSVDDKRFILPNLVDTLPHGHFEIPFYLEEMVKNNDVNTDHIVLEIEGSEQPQPIEVDDDDDDDV